MHIPDEKWQNLDPKSEKCILVGYSLEKKGYKCFNPSTQKVHVSRDVVFDESAPWYKPEPTPLEPYTANLKYTEDNDQLRFIFEENPISIRLSGPQEPPSEQSVSWPSLKSDKGKAKMPEYEDDQSDDNESAHLLDNKLRDFDVPIMRTLRAKKSLTTENEKLCQSTREKTSSITIAFRSGRIADSTFRFLSQLWKLKQSIETCYASVTCLSTHKVFAKLNLFNKFQNREDLFFRTLFEMRIFKYDT